MEQVKDFLQDNLHLVKGIAFLVAAVAVVMWLKRDPPVVVGPSPRSSSRVLIMLHGYGASKTDLEPLSKELSQTAPKVRFIMPSAPHSIGIGRAWIPSFSEDTQQKADRRLIELRAQARLVVKEIIADLVASGVQPRNIYVGGFSQGATIALDVLLNEPSAANLGGLVYLSGGGIKLALSDLGNHAPLNAFAAHGRSDSVVPFSLTAQVVEALKEGGHQVEFVQFEGGHTISPPVRSALGAFLLKP